MNARLPLSADLERIGTIMMDGQPMSSYRVLGESFDGDLEHHYFCVPDGLPSRMECATHEKIVPLGTPAHAVPWQPTTWELEC